VPRALAYHRPESVDIVVGLLSATDHLALAGGTVLNADDDPTPVSMVDLQACGLGGITAADSRLRLGAMATLGDLVDDDRIPSGISDAARAELPSTLRTLATVGGTVAAGGPDSVLLAALIVHDARVDVVGPDGATTTPLADLLATGVPPGNVVTAVDIDPTGDCVRHATGRTPADAPIVSATARTATDGVRLTLTGVADHPVPADPADPAAGLAPTGDFRGSADYRLHLAEVLATRAVAQSGEVG